MTSIAALNAADRATFVAAVGFAFEGSPWIAEAAWPRRPFASLDELHAALIEVVAKSSEDRQIALIAAHPDLAGRVAREGRLTAASRGEQAAAGTANLGPIPSTPAVGFAMILGGVLLLVAGCALVAILLTFANARLRAFDASISET